MPPPNPCKDIALLVDSEYPLIYLETWEETRATEILGLVAQDLNIPFYIWSVTTGFARAGGAPIYNTQDPHQALATISSMNGDGLYMLRDFHKYLDQDVVVRKLRDLAGAFRRGKRSVVITSPVITIPVELEKDTARYTLSLPDAATLNALVTVTISDLSDRHRIFIGLPPEMTGEVVASLGGLTCDEARRILTQAVLQADRYDVATIDRIREAKGAFIKDQGVLEFIKVEDGLESVGGLSRLKEWLRKRRGAMTPEATHFGLEPPKGILITGMPGCGKSLCAKAVACEWKMQLLRFDSSTLYDKYIGESEKNLRKSLKVAEAVAPAVLWIDEIEKMFPQSSLTSDADGGVSLRIFGTFLNWMQERKSRVFVVATANNITILPPEFLRKGRFDEIFFVDLPSQEERRSIFQIQLIRHKQDQANFDLAQLAAATEGFSGSEIEQAISSSLYSAFSQKTGLSTEIIRKEIASTFPLSSTMRERLTDLREWARERAVPAS